MKSNWFYYINICVFLYYNITFSYNMRGYLSVQNLYQQKTIYFKWCSYIYIYIYIYIFSKIKIMKKNLYLTIKIII